MFRILSLYRSGECEVEHENELKREIYAEIHRESEVSDEIIGVAVPPLINYWGGSCHLCPPSYGPALGLGEHIYTYYLLEFIVIFCSTHISPKVPIVSSNILQADETSFTDKLLKRMFMTNSS